MEKSTYYQDQLKKISCPNDYSNKIKITGHADEQTNWMDLNFESATTIIEWLKGNYIDQN